MNKFVGVDCHKDSLACYSVDQFKEFANDETGFNAALKWQGKDFNWALEGAYSYGKPFAAFLIKKGIKVYEVNPLITKRYRDYLNFEGKKNDFGDAKIIYNLTQTAYSEKLEPVSFATSRLKELMSSRNLLIKQKSEITNHIKSLYSTRGTRLDFKGLTTQKALNWLINNGDEIVKNQAIILKQLIQFNNELDKLIEKELPEKAKKLTTITGIGPIHAAIIYTEIKGKLYSKAKLASYAGIAPVEISSGKNTRHKHNHMGNRLLNSIFYKASQNNAKYDEKGIIYFQRKLSEGHTKRNAKKCLARQLVNIVWKILNEPNNSIIELDQENLLEKIAA